MTELIVFDLDGTLSDSKTSIVLTFQEACRSLSVPVPSAARVEGLIGLPLDVMFPRALAASHPELDAELNASLVADYKNKLQTHLDATLSSKIGMVAKDLEKRSLLTKAELKPIKSLQSNKGGLLHGSATTMNQYVHNPDFHPEPTELRASWDKLQKFLAAVVEHR